MAVFTRRNPETVKIQTEGVKVYPIAEAYSHKEEIDVLILCGGSATDLPVQTPELAKNFNVIDSFDTHARIPEHFADVDKACKEGHTVGIISVGWDPGLFSLNRIYAESILPNGKTYTFWGKGVSQGHSDAIRRVAGVKRGIQYTIPVPEAVEEVRACKNPELTTRQKHTRECFIVAEEGSDLLKIEEEIKTMPNYFSDYDTTVHFISEERVRQIPHSNASRRFRDPHRKDRQGREHRSAHRVFLKAWFQPGIYLQRSGGLCKSRSSHGFRGTDRLQDRFRCGSGLPFPVKRRGASRPSLIRSAKKDPFLDKRGSFFYHRIV